LNGDPLDKKTDQEEEREDDHQTEIGINAVELKQPVGCIHAEHQELTMGKIDYFKDSEDQGEPNADQSIYPS